MHRRNQLCRHRSLPAGSTLRCRRHRLDAGALWILEIDRVAQQLHDQRRLVRVHRCDVLTRVDHDLREGQLRRIIERVAQQRVGTFAALERRHVVRPVVEHARH